VQVLEGQARRSVSVKHEHRWYPIDVPEELLYGFIAFNDRKRRLNVCLEASQSFVIVFVPGFKKIDRDDFDRCGEFGLERVQVLELGTTWRTPTGEKLTTTTLFRKAFCVSGLRIGLSWYSPRLFTWCSCTFSAFAIDIVVLHRMKVAHGHLFWNVLSRYRVRFSIIALPVSPSVVSRRWA
jgi:hypothetical protein